MLHHALLWLAPACLGGAEINMASILFCCTFVLPQQIYPSSTKCIFTITAEIHVRSLANFYCQYPDRHMNLKFVRRVSERESAIRQFVIVKKQVDVSF